MFGSVENITLFRHVNFNGGRIVISEGILNPLWISSAYPRTSAMGSLFSKVLQNLFNLNETRDHSKNKRLTIEAEIRVVPAANEPGQWIPKGKIRRPRGFINALKVFRDTRELTGEGLRLINHVKAHLVEDRLLVQWITNIGSDKKSGANIVISREKGRYVQTYLL